MPPGVRPVERVYEADIIRNATKPKAAPVVPTILGSRAFANARGVQAGLNIPGSTKATQSQGVYPAANPIQAAATARLSGGGSSGGGAVAPVDPLAGYVADKADLSKNPIPGLYDQLLAYTKENADARPAIFQAVSDKFKVNQDAANQQLYDAYMGSRTAQDQSATALGVDPAIVAQARDLAMRKNKENSDQSLADNQAWLLKAGLLSQQDALARGNQYAKDKVTQSAGWDQLEEERVAQLNLLKLQAFVDALNAKKGSGGGGGGRRKGGSSGGSVSTTATETGTAEYGGQDLAYYNQLLASGDKQGAAAFRNAVNLASGNPVTKLAQGNVNAAVAASMVNGKQASSNSFYYLPGKAPKAPAKVINPAYTAAVAAKGTIPTHQTVLRGAEGLGGVWAQPKVTTKVTNTGKKKT
jgi:hypothetical protein